MSKFQEIKEFIEKCPLLDGNKISVDYLKDEVYSYSIDRTPTQPIQQKFVDGFGGKKQISFDFTVTAPLSSQSIVNLQNSQFGEDFVDWITTQNRLRNLPNIKRCFFYRMHKPIIHTSKNTNNSNLYYTDDFYVLRAILIDSSIFL